jgi:hypothetical protein
MKKITQERFRGLHSWYDPKTDTYFIYIYDKTTHNIKVNLKITGNAVQIVMGQPADTSLNCKNIEEKKI